jgi:cell fate regulator YaaT (PSP1 superfamily)
MAARRYRQHVAPCQMKGRASCFVCSFQFEGTAYQGALEEIDEKHERIITHHGSEPNSRHQLLQWI